ncbi:UNVERIFIED_CONTAM: hypothetical protein PYX00_004022 [Menopon gallinae]|uniref:Uncharacterized protein n=1 Tax=Menopon gallinae TaxID=328185 RepID=A0AAW2I286_9NEOP
MSQGNKLLKSNELPQKDPPEKIVSPKIITKCKLPEKTKFTMKYDYSNKTKKPTEKKTSSPVTENESPNAKENAANPRQRTDNESNTCALRATVSKCCDLPKTKIPSSSQFLSKIESMVKTSIDKRKNSHTKRIGRTVAPAKMACDLMGALLPAKPEGTRGNHIPRKPGSKPNVKLSSFSRLPVLKKSLVSHGTDKGKEVKSTSETSRLNSKRNDICPESAGTFNESRVVSQSEETRTDPTKQRAKSTELKRNKSDGNALKVVSGRKSAPRDNSHDSARDRIKHLESEPIKRTDCAKTNKEGTKGSVVRHKSKDRDAKTRTSQPRSTDAATVKRTSKEVVDTKKNEADIREEPVGKMPKKKDDINIRDPIPNFDTENLLKVTVQSVDNYDSFMADDRSGNDDFVNLDKKLWGDLELSNTDPSCKTDFSLDNDESLSDIIQQLLIPHSEVEMNEDKFEPNTNFIEDWKTETTKAKKPAPEPIIKEPPAHTKPPQVKFREKSVKPHVESHTHKDVSKTTEKTHHKSSGMTAKRVEDNKLNTHRENTIIGDNTPAFLRDYKNIGFIGKEADEDFVSFDMNQMTLYQPHENQMLVYDLANCIAMQVTLLRLVLSVHSTIRERPQICPLHTNKGIQTVVYSLLNWFSRFLGSLFLKIYPP